MRFVIECFCGAYFFAQTLANTTRGMTAWQRWVETSALAWRTEYAQRFCARTHAAELNFAAARTFWLLRLDASLVEQAHRRAWDVWTETLLHYETLEIRCDPETLWTRHEENASIPKLYPNWVVKHAL